MDIGYARVSTGEQTIDLQLDALKAAGCGAVYQETASGAKADRPVLDEVLSYLRTGDTLVVWRLDRLGRSLKHLIEVVAALAERGIGFKSLTEQIDTTTPGGKLIFHVFAALAEFERDLIRERAHAGLAAARARGRLGGRPRKLADAKQLELARTLYADGEADIETICATLGISRTTLYRALKRSPRMPVAATGVPFAPLLAMETEGRPPPSTPRPSSGSCRPPPRRTPWRSPHRSAAPASLRRSGTTRRPRNWQRSLVRSVGRRHRRSTAPSRRRRSASRPAPPRRAHHRGGRPASTC